MVKEYNIYMKKYYRSKTVHGTVCPFINTKLKATFRVTGSSK